MTDESLIEYPCDFPLKIMGRDTVEFREAAAAIVRRHAGDTVAPDTQPSRDGNYLALRYVVRAHSRAQLDALYEDLSAHHAVLVVL